VEPVTAPWIRTLASADALPFADGVFDVVMADPPYEARSGRRPRGKKRVSPARVGYVEFTGRDWITEAWRVLRPSGCLYVVAAINEIGPWYDAFRKRLGQEPDDMIAWHAPNAASLAAYWRRGLGGRAPTWRPVLMAQKPPKKGFVWPDGFVQPNHISVSMVVGNMKEALEWPNQLPEKLLTWLLRPHVGGRVLDLFSGTGTCSFAAISNGSHPVALDVSLRALELGARRRTGPTMPMRLP
jgi:DNA modification methylase